jgi:hypothetical protein
MFGNAQTKRNGNKSVRLLLGAAFEFGGDDLATVYFADGSTQSINAGRGGTVFAGGQIQLHKTKKVHLRTSLGIKYVTTKATNANIRLTRIPIQVSVNYVPVKKLRIGAGLVTHQAIKLNFDGLGDNAKFRSVPGPIFEVGYGLVGLSYTLMTYKDKNSISYRANTIGITFSGVL